MSIPSLTATHEEGARTFCIEVAREPVLVAYAATLDGFIKLWPKAIRNPSSPFLVSMQEWTWTTLATHASVSGQFYIPSTPEVNSLGKLRELVLQKETA